MTEKAGELRLALLDPHRVVDGTPALEKMHLLLEKMHLLMKVPENNQVLHSPLRRTQALHLALADELLVCPTHAGLLIGFDRTKMTIRWQYRYRDEKGQPPTLPLWQAACPMIHKSRIIFTAVDHPEVHCLDLDGKFRWTAVADKDLYLATAFEDLVILVGKGHLRALSLEDGKEKWKLETGLPRRDHRQTGAVGD